MTEIRNVYINGVNVEVEVDPNEFKKPAVGWVALFFVGCVFIAYGFALVGWIALLLSPLSWLAHRAAWKGRIDLAVREAAHKGMWGYERSSLMAYKSL